MGSTYTQSPLPTVNNVAKLPGAFFFLSLVFNDTTNSQAHIVAYDPYVTSTSKWSDIVKVWMTNKMPYYEVFDKNAASAWVIDPNKFYLGNYGTPNSTKGFFGQSWYWSAAGAAASATGAAANGVTIAYWNQAANQNKGLFTNAPSATFSIASGPTQITTMYPGLATNFMVAGSELARLVKTIQCDFYATNNGNAIPNN